MVSRLFGCVATTFHISFFQIPDRCLDAKRLGFGTHVVSKVLKTFRARKLLFVRKVCNEYSVLIFFTATKNKKQKTTNSYTFK